MKKLMTLLTAVLIITAVKAQSTVKMIKLDNEKSKVEWKGGKVVGSGHAGTVKLKSATLTEVDGQLKSGQMVIDMTTIACSDIDNADMNAKLIGHLKSDDFFGVDTYPTASLKINSFTNSTEPSKGTHLVKGDLTIKGTTKPVEFYASIKSSGNSYSATASIIVDRSKYDVRYGSDSFFDNLGDKAIKNDMEFRVSLSTK